MVHRFCCISNFDIFLYGSLQSTYLTGHFLFFSFWLMLLSIVSSSSVFNPLWINFCEWCKIQVQSHFSIYLCVTTHLFQHHLLMKLPYFTSCVQLLCHRSIIINSRFYIWNFQFDSILSLLQSLRVLINIAL